MNRRIAVRLALDVVFDLAVQGRYGRSGAQTPAARHGGREANLPNTIAVIEPRDRQPQPAWSNKLRFQIGIEWISAHDGGEAEVVTVVLLERDTVGAGRRKQSNEAQLIGIHLPS